MQTVNSLSGGQTSSYIEANYPADYSVFALVRIEDNNCKFKDEKIRLLVEDKIQAPFIGTAEDDMIIYTMLDLEQYTGRKIHWVTGKTFDEVIKRRSGEKVYLPNKTQRFCTIEMKLEPIFYWCAANTKLPVEMRIGYRANEKSRAESMLERCVDGLQTHHATFEKHENGNNKWADVLYRKPAFPLITDNIFKDDIINYWRDKPVRFAVRNNCIGCFHRNVVLLKHMSNVHPEKFGWFVDQEKKAYDSSKARWKSETTYENITKRFNQHELFDTDFNECDSGYCEVN